MSLVVLHLVAAVGYLVMEETVKALEAKVAKLGANLAKKSETNAASSHSSAGSSIALRMILFALNPKPFRLLWEKTGWCGYGNLKTSLR